MPPKTQTRQSLTLNQCQKLFNFILQFSRKTLTFPTGEEMTGSMGLTTARVYQLLVHLENDGLVKQIDRYHFRLTQKGRKTRLRKVK